MSHLRLVHSLPSCPAPHRRFRARDLVVLHDFMRDSAPHGYVRAVLEPGSGPDLPENGGYVLLYREDRPWAQWGLTRVGDAIEVWDCATGADAGRFHTMHAALDSLRHASPATRPQERDHAQPALAAFL